MGLLNPDEELQDLEAAEQIYGTIEEEREALLERMEAEVNGKSTLPASRHSRWALMVVQTWQNNTKQLLAMLSAPPLIHRPLPMLLRSASWNGSKSLSGNRSMRKRLASCGSRAS